ncbi:hypothetical protein [Enterococcus ureilyticus]|nr:hypothetical protein [Enterococcus ureilyticus]MBM7690508.1 hypothetical protein [Enterococcus ureilyticus]
MGKQWGHGFHTGKKKGRQEASIFFGAISLTYMITKKGMSILKKIS